MKKKFQVISAVICIVMPFGVTGCQKSAVENSFVKCVVEDENTEVQTIYHKEINPDDENSIDYLREYMSYFTEAIIGVCYLGHRDKDSTVPLADWIRASAPELVEKFPFILEITADKDLVLGDGYGDLFCFVPKDNFTTLRVDHVTWTSDEFGVLPMADKLLYQAEYTKPVLVFSNYEQFWDEPNVMIIAYTSDGSSVNWYPCRNIDNNGILDIPSYYKEDSYAGIYEAKLLVDFTDIVINTEIKDPFCWNAWDYIKAIDPYDVMDDSWSAVYDTALINTKWQCGDDWYISFEEGNCDPAYTGCVEIYQQAEQGNSYQMMYSGVWRMEEEYLRLETVSTSDTGTFGGSFLILVAPSGEQMDMYIDYRTGVTPPFFIEGTGFMTLTYRYE